MGGKKRNSPRDEERNRRDEGEMLKKENGKKARRRREREKSIGTGVDITDFTDQLTNRLTCRVTSSIENYLTGTRCLVTGGIAAKRNCGPPVVPGSTLDTLAFRGSARRTFSGKRAIMVGRVIYPRIFPPIGSLPSRKGKSFTAWCSDVLPLLFNDLFVI